MMVNENFFKNILVLLTGIALPVLSSEDIASATWDGVGAFIAVDASRVQARLDQYSQNTPGAPQLYVPAIPVFSNLECGQHVIYIDFGTMTSLDFKDTPELSSSGSESTIVIPFLSASVNGTPHYNLALSEMYQADRGDIPQTFLLLSYNGVEELTVAHSSAILRQGEEELAVEFQISNPCNEPSNLIVQEFNETTLKNLNFVSPDPDLTFCGRHPNIPRSNSYCSKMKEIRDEVEMSLPNVCTSFTVSSEHSCEASLEVKSITTGFREILLLDEGPINVVSSERFYGTYDVGLQYPCVERCHSVV